MGAHQKSVIKQALDRLDTLMAIGESRQAAKQEQRAAGEAFWTFSTGKIHSFKTRSVYQEHVLAFVNWVRELEGITTLEELDHRANELATQYLHGHLQAGKSPYTLQVERSALRLFFNDRRLAETACIPRRTSETITRSRGPKAHDRHFQPANWPELVCFLKATGLRRREVQFLRVRDLFRQHDGGVMVAVVSGKGGRAREVPVLPAYTEQVWALTNDREPEQRVFERIPKHLDVHSYRREYAQAYYQQLSGRALPPATGRLKRTDYDEWAVLQVSHALGHNRRDVVLRHYLR